MKLWKKLALEEAEKEIIYIEDDGHKFERLTDWHWKIDDINVWPSSKKFQKQGGVVQEYQQLKDILK